MLTGDRLGVWMGRGRARTHRRSLGAALTFAVAAVAGVAGNRLTGEITPALAVFVGLVTAGMLLTYWLDRRATANSGDHQDGGGEADSRGAADLRGAQGVQLGNGNWQLNYFNRDRDG
jgi:hypothetical protein